MSCIRIPLPSGAARAPARVTMRAIGAREALPAHSRRAVRVSSAESEQLLNECLGGLTWHIAIILTFRVAIIALLRWHRIVTRDVTAEHHNHVCARIMRAQSHMCDGTDDMARTFERAYNYILRSAESAESGTSGTEAREESVAPKQQEEELPPWVRKEMEKKNESKDLPFGLYLIASALVAIASIGSVFEIVNKNPLFGVLEPDNPLWFPILAVFALTGLPTAGFLFFKSVGAANAAADRMDRMDGM